MGCCKVRKSDFGLRFDDNSVFANSQWKFIHPVVFCIYRAILGVYFFGWLMYTMTTSITNSGGAYFLYLTNWGFMTLTFYLVTASFTTLYYHIRNNSRTDTTSNNGPKSTPWYFMLSWLLFNLAAIIAPIITLIYWASLYEGAGLEINDFHVHAANFIAVALEVIIAGMPVRFMHVIYPSIYGVIYLIHSLIYWGVTGNAIYPILDYSGNPGIATATAFGCLAMVLFFQFLLWGTYIVKTRLVRRRAVSVEDDSALRNSGVTVNGKERMEFGVDNPAIQTADKQIQTDIEEGV